MSYCFLEEVAELDRLHAAIEAAYATELSRRLNDAFCGDMASPQPQGIFNFADNTADQPVVVARKNEV